MVLYIGENPIKPRSKSIQTSNRQPLGLTCMVCHRCHPRVRIQYFVAPSDGTMIYYYILYTCQTPVERSLAQEQTPDDDEDFDPQWFFSMRVIQDEAPLEEEGFEVVDIEGNTHNIHESEEPHVIHYLDDSIEATNTGIILDFNEEESSRILEEYRDTLHSNIPRLVQIYRTDHAIGRTSFSRFAQVCQTLDRIALNIRANNGTHPSAPHPSTEYDTGEPDIELPELIDISEGGRDATVEEIHHANQIIL